MSADAENIESVRWRGSNKALREPAEQVIK